MSSWEDVLHPALLWLACEAVGGKAEDTVKVLFKPLKSINRQLF
jgi:hypothetical protein